MKRLIRNESRRAGGMLVPHGLLLVKSALLVFALTFLRITHDLTNLLNAAHANNGGVVDGDTARLQPLPPPTDRRQKSRLLMASSGHSVGNDPDKDAADGDDISKMSLQVLFFETSTPVESSPRTTHITTMLHQLSGIPRVHNATIFGQGALFHGFGVKQETVLPILQAMINDESYDENRIVVISDSRDVLLNLPVLTTMPSSSVAAAVKSAAADAVDDFLRRYRDLTANHPNPNVVVVAAEAQCCVTSLSRNAPSDFYVWSTGDPQNKSRRMRRTNTRACTDLEPNCTWGDTQAALPWKTFMEVLAYQAMQHRTRSNRHDGYADVYEDVYLNAGLMAGTASNLWQALTDAQIGIDEDDQALMTAYWYWNPDAYVLDYGQTMFGNSRHNQAKRDVAGCVFDHFPSTGTFNTTTITTTTKLTSTTASGDTATTTTTSSTTSATTNHLLPQRLVHTKTRTTPLFLHNPGKFVDCHNRLALQLGHTIITEMNEVNQDSSNDLKDAARVAQPTDDVPPDDDSIRTAEPFNAVETDHSPQRPDWAALCAVMKNEDLYIDEWTDYHLALGFEHIYIYDNHHNFTLSTWYSQRQMNEAKAEPSSSATSSRVHLKHKVSPDHNEYYQYALYGECLEGLRSLGNPPKWVMVLDGDEFLVFRDMDRYPNVTTFFTEHVKSGSLQLSWVVMGSSYELHYRNEPVTKRFQMALDPATSPFMETKAVAVLDHVQGWQVHNAVHKDGFHGHGMGGREPGFQGFDGWIANGDTTVAAVFHYKYKSYQEFNYKQCVRGDINFWKNACPTSVEIGTVWDDAAWHAMQRLVPKHAMPRTGSLPAMTRNSSLVTPVALSHSWAALCVVARDENRYMSEWTDYHLALGFEHIYVFDSHPNFTMSHWHAEWRKQETGAQGDTEKAATTVRDRVHLFPRVPPETGPGTEIVYRECMQELRSLSNPPKWVMAMDVDDFLVIRDRERYPHVAAFLTDHLETGALEIGSVVMGSAGETMYREEPVTRRFQMAISALQNGKGKPVAVLNHITSLKKHYATDRRGYRAVAQRRAHDNNLVGPTADTSAAAVYHYRYKSLDEYRNQQCGQNVLNCTVQVETGDIFDDSAWRALAQVVPKYAL